MNEYPGQARAQFLALVDLKAKAKTPAPVAAIFDGGLEKDQLAHAQRELNSCHGIIARLKRQNKVQRATIRRAYKLLRKAGFTLKAI